VRIAPAADILVMAAAVADYAPAKPSGRKIKRGAGSLRLELVPNPDIIAEVGEMPDEVRPFLVGFAAESDDLEVNATGKLRDKGLDLIVAKRWVARSTPSAPKRTRSSSSVWRAL